MSSPQPASPTGSIVQDRTDRRTVDLTVHKFPALTVAQAKNEVDGLQHNCTQYSKTKCSLYCIAMHLMFQGDTVTRSV